MAKKRIKSIAIHVYGTEPLYTGELTKSEIINYLNWTSKNFDRKKKKEFAIELSETLNVDTKKLKTVSDERFITIGAVSKIILNGGVVKYDIESKLNDLVKEYSHEQISISSDKKIKKQENNNFLINSAFRLMLTRSLETLGIDNN